MSAAAGRLRTAQLTARPHRETRRGCRRRPAGCQLRSRRGRRPCTWACPTLLSDGFPSRSRDESPDLVCDRQDVPNTGLSSRLTRLSVYGISLLAAVLVAAATAAGSPRPLRNVGERCA